MQVITSSSKELDKEHRFCKANFVANLAAGLVCPIFGAMNDWMGVRVNSAICMLSLAILGFLLASFELYTDLNKLWYLIFVHFFIYWNTVTLSFSCSKLFGIMCGLYCFSYVKLATVVAAACSIPLLLYSDCFHQDKCEDIVSYVVSGLLFCGFLLSLMLNPKSLV